MSTLFNLKNVFYLSNFVSIEQSAKILDFWKFFDLKNASMILSMISHDPEHVFEAITHFAAKICSFYKIISVTYFDEFRHLEFFAKFQDAPSLNLFQYVSWQGIRRDNFDRKKA